MLTEQKPLGKGRGVAIIPDGKEWDAFVRYARETAQPITYEVYMVWKSGHRL
jgi:hypothetical protein